MAQDFETFDRNSQSRCPTIYQRNDMLSLLGASECQADTHIPAGVYRTAHERVADAFTSVRPCGNKIPIRHSPERALETTMCIRQCPQQRRRIVTALPQRLIRWRPIPTDLNCNKRFFSVLLRHRTATARWTAPSNPTAHSLPHRCQTKLPLR